MNFILFVGLFALPFMAKAQEIDMNLLQCLVCRVTIEEVESNLMNTNPSHNIDIGNYRLDAQGNMLRKQVPLRKSEVHISDVLDNICVKLEDYARARYKSDGRLTVMRLMSPSGGLNPEMSNVDIIQDGDLNKSLKHYCEGIVEEYEESIIEAFQKGERDMINQICTRRTHVCADELSPDDEEDQMTDSDRDEL